MDRVQMLCVSLFVFGLVWTTGSRHVEAKRPIHPWLKGKKAPVRTLLYRRIKPPRGYTRRALKRGSFAHWLRRLPLMPVGSPVMLYNGRKKAAQMHHVAVVRLDIGRRDLQQCADAVMRLWGEFLWSRKLERLYHFRMLSGQSNPWWRWARGDRRRFRRGRMLGWRRRARRPNHSYLNFRRHLKYVMAWTNTSAMVKQLKRIPISQARAGDLFLVGWHAGGPGHAILLVDEVQNSKGQKKFLLAQSYMPAQSFHLLKAPGQRSSPWFSFPRKGTVRTPEWNFSTKQMYRLPHTKQTSPK